MAGRVPRMRTPRTRQLVGTSGIRLETIEPATTKALVEAVEVISGISASQRVVTYTATGTEGADFMVPIGATLATASYAVMWSPAGVTNLPLLDLPTGAGDRTTTHFRVLVGGELLQAGDTLTFVISIVS